MSDLTPDRPVGRWDALLAADLPDEVTIAQLAEVTGFGHAGVRKQVVQRWGLVPVPDRWGPFGARFYLLADVVARVEAGVSPGWPRGRRRSGESA